MDDRFKDFCLNISKARMSLNMSAYELSLQLGKDRTYISKVETGKVNIGIKTIYQICDILQIDPKTLL